jgi:hypothetical protein
VVFEISFKKGTSVSSFPQEKAPTNGNAGLHSKECRHGKKEGNLKLIAPYMEKPVTQANKMKAAWQKKDEQFLS